ncbi:Zn(2+)-responsive transcriptional regulator [Celerinatantimonas diazotrophica]|uniref:MerR family transcriptional regulator n=1 Tax=Celerinatantimonas diazotrophica TaxID=412034 RepID=A0A4V2PR78_9GAMM|nr:Zn(2+)-responsive transcriptional regulator [Celerinatantimonas diazotrophica]TCK57851.1 MerR family transcriptional regulator [Celerinatantimonas diazotrophica]CAG9298084.1 HTH-type transcriptional regulator ZntR [Celerinatantimonas diazotrophica]
MYQIGELAKLCEISTETIRFYEKEGLLKEPSRAANGYRLYSDQDLGRLRFILRGKNAGLSNSDMLEMVSIRENRQQLSCRDVRQVVDNKLAIVRKQIQELKSFEYSLSDLSQTCCGGDESATHCAILETLDDILGERHVEHHHHDVSSS